jgi:hypothetical protein
MVASPLDVPPELCHQDRPALRYTAGITEVFSYKEYPSPAELDAQLLQFNWWYSEHTGKPYVEVDRDTTQLTVIAFLENNVASKITGLYCVPAAMILVTCKRGPVAVRSTLFHELLHHHLYLAGDPDWKLHAAPIWAALEEEWGA